MATWQVQTAKQRFSELLRSVEAGEPQFISRHGATVAVIIDVADYRRTHEERPSLGDFLLAGPRTDGLEIAPRRAEPDRSIGMFGNDE